MLLPPRYVKSSLKATCLLRMRGGGRRGGGVLVEIERIKIELTKRRGKDGRRNEGRRVLV